MRRSIHDAVRVSPKKAILRLSPNTALVAFKKVLDDFNKKPFDKITVVRFSKGKTEYKWRGDRSMHVPKGFVDVPANSANLVRIKIVDMGGVDQEIIGYYRTWAALAIRSFRGSHQQHCDMPEPALHIPRRKRPDGQPGQWVGYLLLVFDAMPNAKAFVNMFNGYVVQDRSARQYRVEVSTNHVSADSIEDRLQVLRLGQ